MNRKTANLIGSVLFLLVSFNIHAETEKSKPTLENLLRAQLEGAPGTEVIISRIEIPPNTSLPKHWHPGEEFGYVLEGSVILWQEGENEVLVEAGSAIKIHFKKVHTAITQEQGCTVLVFRVHEQGEPERVLVE